MRLDQESSAKADRDGGRAIVPGDAKGSELYRRITADDPAERMPPQKSGKSLSAVEIEKLGRWIDQGAKWQPHWSFIPPAQAASARGSQTVNGSATRSTRSSRLVSSAKGSRRPAKPIAAS